MNKKVEFNENAVFALSKSKSPSEVTLRSAEWAVITQIDGHKTVKDISNLLSMGNDEAIGLFHELIKKELIELQSMDEEKMDYIPADFFNMLEAELTKVIGPVAPLILDDTIMEMDTTKDHCLPERIPELIEMLSEEIVDSEKKVKFQQIMLNQLKGMM
ncbi:MAG TPA: hypothetical protein ENO27_01530 [Caldithrix sp.]|nr:hypothetical protein [Calditrichaceae bacterium]HEM48869.1 hypothetical protein [Caldithrix sp.]HES59321.1 hypothetical protein [Caldithrix sp.]